MPAPDRRSPRGLTLLELLVVAAISSVLVLAAASMLVSALEQRAVLRKRMERLTDAFSTLTLLEGTAANVGYHFPSPRFGFRLYNNVTSGTYGGFGVGAGCATEYCVVPTTDVMEVVEGTPGPFWVAAADATVIDLALLDVSLNSGAGGLPDGDVGPHTFLATDTYGHSCLGTGTLNATGNKISWAPMNRNWQVEPSDYYSTGSPAPYNYLCPAKDMVVAVAQKRRQFLVLTQQDGGELGLYVHDAPPDGGPFEPSSGVAAVGLNVDNMQVSPLARNDDAGFTVGCANGTCLCNRGGSCSLDGGSDDGEFVVSDFVIGAQVAISVRGEQIQRAYDAGVRRSLGDETHPDDAIVRLEESQTYMFRNFSQVMK